MLEYDLDLPAGLRGFGWSSLQQLLEAIGCRGIKHEAPKGVVL
jgi:hypothetical protein